jgi:hypothetical protein
VVPPEAALPEGAASSKRAEKRTSEGNSGSSPPPKRSKAPSAEQDTLTEEDVAAMKVKELQKALADRGLPRAGRKAELQERLLEYLASTLQEEEEQEASSSPSSSSSSSRSSSVGRGEEAEAEPVGTSSSTPATPALASPPKRPVDNETPPPPAVSSEADPLPSQETEAVAPEASAEEEVALTATTASTATPPPPESGEENDTKATMAAAQRAALQKKFQSARKADDARLAARLAAAKESRQRAAALLRQSSAGSTKSAVKIAGAAISRTAHARASEQATEPPAKHTPDKLDPPSEAVVDAPLPPAEVQPPVTIAKPTMTIPPATIANDGRNLPIPSSGSSITAPDSRPATTPLQSSAPSSSVALNNKAAPNTVRTATYGPGPILPPVAKGLPSAEKRPEDNYDMSDKDGSSDSDSQDEEGKPRKRIPDWARAPQLEDALRSQFGENLCDPDHIFRAPTTSSCDLEAVFMRPKDSYRVRRSTGDWQRDRLTEPEVEKYRKDMGFGVPSTVPEESS